MLKILSKSVDAKICGRCREMSESLDFRLKIVKNCDFHHFFINFSLCTTGIYLWNVSFKFSLQVEIKMLQKVAFTYFFVIPINWNFFKILFIRHPDDPSNSSKNLKWFGWILIKFIVCFKNCSNINGVHYTSCKTCHNRHNSINIRVIIDVKEFNILFVQS